MKIPINTPDIGREEIREVHNTLKKGALTSSANQGGESVRKFEKSASSYLKSKYVIAVNSGTAALQAALMALGIKRGDEVLLPSFTFVATANAVTSTGAKPIFVDILRSNYTIDPKNLAKQITKKTRAIIPVHLYGNIAFIEELSDIAKKYNMSIIEDAAQSMGSTYQGKQSGTFFDMGCYSLYPAKVMTAGEGGFISTDNKKLRDKLLMIRNHGMLHGYDTRILGLNLRMPEISAAIANAQIKKLPRFLNIRRKNAKLLSELISDLDIIVPSERRHEHVNWYLYTVATKNRNKILKKLNQRGISATAYYPTPTHKTPYYKSRIKLPVTDWASSSVMSLPIHPLVTSKDIEYVAKSLHESIK